MTDSLLSGFRAIELTDEKGFVCGKILAAMGVDVIKIEKTGGDPSRNIPPFYQDSPDPEKSLYWLAFNTDKRSITLNLEESQGQELFRKLAERVDFILESFQPGFMDSHGIGYEALSRINPRIIMTSITPFGQKGPYSHYKASNLVSLAMSGILDNIGEPDRPPVKEALDSVYYEAAGAAALGTIISHYHREMTGEGQQVDISLQRCAAIRNTDNQFFWEFARRILGRQGSYSMLSGSPRRWIYPCKDGDLVVRLERGMGGKPPGYKALSQWMDEEEAENPFQQGEDLDKFNMASLSRERQSAVEKGIIDFFSRYTREEIRQEALKRGIIVWVASSPSETMKSQQLFERDFWKSLNHPGSDITLDYPRHFFLSDKTENYVRKAAPHIGEHNNEIYQEELGLSAAEISQLKSDGII
ncbi:CaiB/BaiF CoA transferase family protein [Thermodesulfobacteriota bacterium]